MDIKNCRRLLALGAPACGTLDIIKDLTGDSPAPDDETGSTAGLTHEWNIKTAYYKANVPVWIDELTDVEKWAEEFMKYEAKEVVTAVGAWVYCFRAPNDGKISKEVERTMKAISDIVEHHIGYVSETLMVAVAVPNPKDSVSAANNLNQEDWEDWCSDYGFEFINYSATGKNEYGEKLGRERLKETLEANGWDATDGDDFLDVDDLDFDADDDAWFDRDEAEMTGEIYGMKGALQAGRDGFDDDDKENAHGQAMQVDDLEKLMGKLMAVKEQSVDLPDTERRQLAARTVRELMGEAI